jgi:rare lipoprotein A
MQAGTNLERARQALHAPHQLATRGRAWTVAALAGLLLVGCASTPQGGGASAPASLARPSAAPDAERDGPEAQPPPGLVDVPDAEPRIEPIRTGGPNKPYEVLGREYVPLTEDRPFVERGLATWYGRKFQGRRTSSGELYNMYEMTAAHPTLPIPSYARVRNPANGLEVVVRINDRGPFHPGRIVDLSYTAALKLDLLRGAAPVEIERITQEEIRSGAWPRPAPDMLLASRTANAPLPATPAAAALPIAPPAPAPSPPRVPPADVTPRPTPVDTGSAEATGRAYTAQAQGFWVQIGAFRERSGAEALQRRIATELDWLAPLLAIFNESMVHRLQAGPYASRSEASSASQRIRQALQVVPVIVERR